MTNKIPQASDQAVPHHAEATFKDSDPTPTVEKRLRTYSVRLITKGFFEGTVEASSEDDAIDETFRLWCTECPHPFEKSDDSELIDVIVEGELS